MISYVIVISLSYHSTELPGLRSLVSESIKAQGAIYPGSKGSYFAWCVLGSNEIKLFGSGQLAFYKDKIGT
jgi:hypothetical protein